MPKKPCPDSGSGHNDHQEHSEEYRMCEREAERHRRLLTAQTAATARDAAFRHHQTMEGMRAEESVLEQLARLANRPSPRNNPDGPSYGM